MTPSTPPLSHPLPCHPPKREHSRQPQPEQFRKFHRGETANKNSKRQQTASKDPSEIESAWSLYQKTQGTGTEITEKSLSSPMDLLSGKGNVESALSLLPKTDPLLAGAVEVETIQPLTPTAQSLFHYLAELITVVKCEDIEETVVVLQDDPFGSSALNGLEIRIKEYSIAPKAYNIELIASPAALELLSSQVGALMNSFATSSFTFEVNRCEVHLRSEREELARLAAAVHRKEEASGARS